MDDGTGTSATDSANGNNATITGAGWNEAGKFEYSGDDSLVFGSGDYANVADPTGGELDFGSATTWNI